MLERMAFLYCMYIVEGLDADYLRQQIHKQITHEFEKVELSEQVDHVLHNLDTEIGFSSEEIKRCGYMQARQKQYADLLTTKLLELYNSYSVPSEN